MSVLLEWAMMSVDTFWSILTIYSACSLGRWRGYARAKHGRRVKISCYHVNMMFWPAVANRFCIGYKFPCICFPTMGFIKISNSGVRE